MILGLILAVLSAVGTNAAFLFKHRGAVAVPAVDGRHPIRSARNLFGSKWWNIGWLVAVLAWCFHVGALSLARLSLVQAVLAGGLVFLAVLAERFFGLRLQRRQWTGLAITATGLAVIGVTSRQNAHEEYSLAALIAVEAAVFLLSVVVAFVSGRVERVRRREGVLLGAAAGALFGVSDIAIKFITDGIGDSSASLVGSWAGAALAASLISFYASARSLQLGPAVTVITFTSVAANLVAIFGGILIFHDPLGHGAAEIVGRLIAFGFVIAGAGLMPAPVRVHHHHRHFFHRRAERRAREEGRSPRPRPRPGESPG